jgi:hypothetical protein
MFAHLAHGYVMKVVTGAGAGATFDLKDSYHALELAYSCVIKYQAKLGSLAQKNVELQKWIARNPWTTDPRYAAQAKATLVIDRQLMLEGGTTRLAHTIRSWTNG